MTLRDKCIEAIASSQCRSFVGIKCESHYQHTKVALRALDAILDTLTEHADEWEDAAFQLPKEWKPSTDPLCLEPEHLLAVLRETTDE